MSGGFPINAALLVRVYRDAAMAYPQMPPDGAANPYGFIAYYGGNSCGSTSTAYIFVQRDSGVATPVAYTLSLTLDRYINWPTQITGIAPTSGPVGTAVTIAGHYLLPQVAFQGAAATVTNSSDTSITTSVPEEAKTGPITVFATPSQQVFTVTAPAPVGPGSPRTATLSTAVAGASACCAVTPNPALAGRLGRLAVAFPPAAVPSGTQVAVIKDGKDLQAGYGSQSWELLPGTYDLRVSGKIVSNISVQARSDTTVRVGVLRVSASSATHWEVLDGSTTIANGYGVQLVGLPIGSYSFRVAGQTEAFTIRQGQITDF
jgi:hypothetical protein